MDMDVDGFAVLLAARLAAIVPDGFHVELTDDMLWFTSDQGRFPGQQGNYRVGATGIRPHEDFITCTADEGTAEECAAHVAWHALDVLQDYIAEAIHEPWPGQRTMPEARAQARGSVVHLWYGGTDDEVLACEPISLAGPRDS
jgi:hypothetical protein